MSGTKAFNRFRPPAVTAAVAALELAQEHHAAACAAAWIAFLADFAELYLPFRGATQALAALDALHSLACVARNAGCGPATRCPAPWLIQMQPGCHVSTSHGHRCSSQLRWQN